MYSVFTFSLGMTLISFYLAANYYLHIMRSKGGYTYIVSNKNRTVLYIGVTDDLSKRTWEHKQGIGSAFTKKYNCTDLLYYEFHDSIETAIQREKRLKKWNRKWKEELITKFNPEWRDLYDQVEELR